LTFATIDVDASSSLNSQFKISLSLASSAEVLTLINSPSNFVIGLEGLDVEAEATFYVYNVG
jgi:hypothetical protein